MIESRAWDIISPYDISDISASYEVRMKYNRSKSGNDFSKRRKSDAQERPRKSFPKKINNDSHVLAPTRSSLQKTINNTKNLKKSKSSTNLINKPSKKEKIIIVTSKKPERKTEIINYFDEPEEISQYVFRKTSNPKNLEIDTEIIEKEYISPIQYNQLPIDIMKLDTINFYSSAFTLKEAISSDLLTGKIYPSAKNIQKSMLKKNEFQGKKFKKKDWFKGNEAIELIYRVSEEKKEIIKKILYRKNDFFKKKVNKSIFIRHPRSLEEVSAKIGKIIEVSLLKVSNSLQDLIEKNSEISQLALNYSPQFCQSQEFFIDLFFCLWDYKFKPLTAHSLSVYLESDRMISEIPKLKDPTLKLQHILNFIPLLIITWRHTEALSYVQQCFKLVPTSKSAIIWQAWLEILAKKSTSRIYYQLNEAGAPPNLSVQYKIAQVYSYYYSCHFRSTSRTISLLKSLGLGDWENLIIADLYIRSNDKIYEEQGLKLLYQLSENSNIFINFLASFKLFKILKEYNQYTKALEIVTKTEKFKYPETLKVIMDICIMKINAYLNLELSLNSEIPLVKYQYARLSIKYHLKSPLNKVVKSINISCAYSQLYSISAFQFQVNFWKFILLRKLGIHKLAAKQAIMTLDYESSDKVKHIAINEYIKIIESFDNIMHAIHGYLIKKDVNSLTKVYSQINAVDEYLGSCIKYIISKNIEDKEKIPLHKFEGYFTLWACAYVNAKKKEKQFKPLDGQEEIDKRDKKHPLHILSVYYK